MGRKPTILVSLRRFFPILLGLTASSGGNSPNNKQVCVTWVNIWKIKHGRKNPTVFASHSDCRRVAPNPVSFWNNFGNIMLQWYTGWWFGCHQFYFLYIGNFIIPIDEIIFFRGVAQPPTSTSLQFFGYENHEADRDWIWLNQFKYEMPWISGGFFCDFKFFFQAWTSGGLKVFFLVGNISMCRIKNFEIFQPWRVNKITTSFSTTSTWWHWNNCPNMTQHFRSVNCDNSARCHEQMGTSDFFFAFGIFWSCVMWSNRYSPDHQGNRLQNRSMNRGWWYPFFRNPWRCWMTPSAAEVVMVVARSLAAFVATHGKVAGA